MEERGGSGRRGEEERKSYCVTGATGYIASWLINSLLDKGYSVHATFRNPAKYLPLSKFWCANDRLRIFQADLLEEGSFDEAVKGCIGVFHVAAPMEFSVTEKQNIDCWNCYVQSNIIDPAIRGTLNVLEACLKSKSVKKVVFTSSISTLTAKDSAGNSKAVVDESCQAPVDQVWNTKASGWVYILLKILTENAAFQFACSEGIDLVSVVTSTVSGPFLTPTTPSSIRFLLSPLTGDPGFFSLLSSVSSRIGSIGLVHIEDICNAHIFLMEHAEAQGRYICCTESCTMSDLVQSLAKVHPCPNIQRLLMKEECPAPSEVSSNKLRDLGFTYKFGLQDIIHETVRFCVDHGFLQPIGK